MRDSSERLVPVRANEGALKFLFCCLIAVFFGVISLDRLHWLIYEKPWISPFHEGFTWTFLPAIKMEPANDYWYHYLGLTGLPLVTRLLHWIATTSQGSSELTLDYAASFGKLYFSFLYIAIVLMCALIIRWSGWRFGFPILLMLLMLNYLDPFAGPYHRIVNTMGFFELYLYAYTALMVYLVISFRAGLLHHEATWLAAIGGALAGSLFFDLVINGWLFLFFMASLFALTEGARRWRCVAVAIVSGIVVGPLLLWAAYGFNIWQASFALTRHLYFIAHETGYTELGFADSFKIALPPIQHHVVMFCAGAILILGILERFFRSQGNKDGSRQRSWNRLMSAIDLAFLISAIAFTYAFYRQPSGTIFQSLTLLCLVYMGYRVFVVLPALESQESRRRSWIQMAALVGGLGVGGSALSAKDIPSAINIFVPNHPESFFFQDRIDGLVVRSLDQFFNQFAEQYTAIANPDFYWMISSLIYPLHYVGQLTIPGLPTTTTLLPLEAEVERKYVSRYHFVSELSAVDVSDTCQAPTKPPAEYAERLQGLVDACVTLDSPLGRKIFNMGRSRLPLGRELYLYPFSIPRGKAIYGHAAQGFAWRVPKTDGESRSPRRFLSSENHVGIRQEVYRIGGRYWGWSLMPIDLESAKSSLTPLATPLADGGYRSYLLQISASVMEAYILIFVRADIAP
jgi:hypothetical protein